MSAHSGNILEVKALSIHFHTDRGVIKAVEDIGFAVRSGEVWGLVGESASGKSVISQALVGIVAKPAGRVVSGEIVFKGEDILKKTARQLQELRGNRMAFIPQDPTTALNPLLPIGFQISEALRYHKHGWVGRVYDEVIRVMKVVHIPAPQTRYADYPHQLSGGLKQRVIIATALCCRPEMLIADEPTSALDVTIQVQIMRLIQEIQRKFGMSMILITHNLGLVAQMCHRVAVLYCGRIVEEAPVKVLFTAPRHPYTRGLLASLPRGDKGDVALHTIPGHLPNPLDPPAGCNFAPRCIHADARCSREAPEIEWASSEQRIRCWRWKEL